MLEMASRIHSESEGVKASHTRDEAVLAVVLPLSGAMLSSQRLRVQGFLFAPVLLR
jgi:hypothetical protein